MDYSTKPHSYSDFFHSPCWFGWNGTEYEIICRNPRALFHIKILPFCVYCYYAISMSE